MINYALSFAFRKHRYGVYSYWNLYFGFSAAFKMSSRICTKKRRRRSTVEYFLARWCFFLDAVVRSTFAVVAPLKANRQSTNQIEQYRIAFDKT